MSSDVCKHCTNAGCLDVCPTGAIFRSEHGSVVVQEDVCNGCGTCVSACPFGVIQRRDDGTVSPYADRDQKIDRMGTASKCTLCHDRLVEGEEPACSATCPTQSIRFGEHEDLTAEARRRVADLHERGMTEARLYGANPKDGVGGTGSVFLLLDEPEVYGLPPAPQVPTTSLPASYAQVGIADDGLVAWAGLQVLGRPVGCEPEGRRVRDRFGVPAAGRARGLRPAAGPAGAHHVAARQLREGGHRRRRDGGGGRTVVPGRAPMSISEFDADRPPP